MGEHFDLEISQTIVLAILNALVAVPLYKKYFGFADFWVPFPVHFFEDYWGPIGMPMGPVHYGGLLAGAKKIREQFGVPCGLAFSPTLEGNVTLHTILYASRASIFDGHGSVVFNKNVYATVALKYIQSLYQQAGTPEQLAWGPAAMCAPCWRTRPPAASTA